MCAAAAILTAAMEAGAGALEPGDVEIPLAEWRALTDGRTVTYHLRGRLWGREFFHPGGGRATFVSADGDCATAPWEYVDGLYCFHYAGRDCFRHVRRGDELAAIPTTLGGETQMIVEIADGPLSCAPALSS